MKTGKSLDEWLQEYSQAHRHPVNRAIHLVCVPAILFGMVAFLWNFRVLDLRASYLLMIVVAPFYVWLGLKAVGVMVIELVACVLILSFWPHTVPLVATSVEIFVLASVGQFIGHTLEGSRPQIPRDLTFLLVGPLWVVLEWF